MKRTGLMATLTAATLLLAACSAPDGGDAPGASDEPVAIQTVTIFAAASLARAFDELAELFEKEHQDIDVAPISYDGSSTLSLQIIEGAPVDVFASADQNNMKKVTDEGLADDAQIFATNTLVVAVPAGNPGGVSSIADLARVTTVLCAPEVPCGAASVRLLEAAGVSVTPASLEQNVTAVLQKVIADEADAGLVYATDVAGVAEVESFVPDGADQIVNRYPIVALKDAPSPAAAKLFVEFVLGPVGQGVLAKYGFGTP